LKVNIYFLLKKGAMDLQFLFALDKETWPYVPLNHDCFISARLTLKQDSMAHNTWHLYLLLFLLNFWFSLFSFLLPRLPLRVFNLLDLFIFIAPRDWSSTIQPTKRNLTFLPLCDTLILSFRAMMIAIEADPFILGFWGWGKTRGFQATYM